METRASWTSGGGGGKALDDFFLCACIHGVVLVILSVVCMEEAPQTLSQNR